MPAAAAKIEQSGEWLSTQAISKRVGIHRQTVTQRLEDLGYEPDEERSNAKNKVYWFDDEMEFAIKSAKDTLSAMKIRQLRADAQMRELKLAEARRELVPSHEMVDIIQRIVLAVYQEHVVRQPKRIAAKLARAKNVIEVKKIMKIDEDAIMKRLRSDFERFIA